MVDSSTALPLRTPTEEDRLAEEAKYNRSMDWQDVKDAVENEWIGSWTLKALNRQELDFDPDFQWDDNTWDQMSHMPDGTPLPDLYQDELLEAHSMGHAKSIHKRMVEEYGQNKRLEELGWSGTALRIGAAIGDPMMLGMEVATLGAATPLIVAGKGGRIARALKMGLAATPTIGGGEAFMASQSADKTWKDAMFASAAAFTLGGAAGALSRGALRASDGAALQRGGQSIMDKITVDEAVEAGAGITPRGQAASDGILPDLAGDSVGAVPTPTPYWRMTSDELDEAIKAESLSEAAKMLKALGTEERVKRFDVLQRKMNNYGNPKLADEAADLFDKEFGDLTEAQERLIYGIGEEGISVDELKRLKMARENVDDLEDLPDSEIARILSLGMINSSPEKLRAMLLRDGSDAEALTGIEAREMATVMEDGVLIMGGIEQARKRGLDVDELIMGGMTSRGYSENEAYEVLEAFLKPKSKTNAPEATARALELDGPDDSVGAARAHESGTIRHMSADEEDVPFSRLGKIRYDMVGRLGKSENPLTRKLASLLAEDAVGLVDDAGNAVVTPHTASETATRNFRRSTTKFYRAANPAFREYAKAQKMGWWKRQSTGRDEFFEAVGRAVRSPDVHPDPHIAKVAGELRKLHADILRDAKAAGIRGFDEVAESGTYIMRVHNQNAIRRMHELYGQKTVNRLVATAMSGIGRNAGMDDDRVMKIASSYVENILERGFGHDVSFANLFAKDREGVLIHLLRNSGTSDDDIAYIVSKLHANPNRSRIDRAKQRTDLDETVSIQATNKATNEVDTIHFADMLENNAERLFNSYSKQMSGYGALAKLGISSESDFVSELKKIRQRGADMGLEKGVVDAEEEKLQVIFRSIVGQPINTNWSPKARAISGLIRDYNFMRVMGQVGLAQLAEIGNTVAEVGLRATLQGMPALRTLFRDARTGKLSNEFLDEIELLMGTGTDRLRNQNFNRFDDVGGTLDDSSHFEGLQRVAHVGTRAVADASLMNGINMALQRTAASAAFHKFANEAAAGSVKISDRLKGLGIKDQDMLDRIFHQINTKVDQVEGGLTGRKIKSLMMDTWDDQEAASVFIGAVDRQTKRMIQENDIGNLSQFMTSDLGKIIIQFRTFAAVSYSKQLLRNIALKDSTSAQVFTFNLVSGSLAYLAQVASRAPGQEDMDSYLEEKLSMDRIAAGSFTKSAYSSILPPILDTIIDYSGAEPIFSHRSSGLSSSGLLQNPTTDLLDRMRRTVGASAEHLTGESEFSKADLRNATGMLALQNAYGIYNTLQALVNETNLPDYSN